MTVHDIDYWENDAILVIGDQRLYFQFSKEPSVGEALEFLLKEGRIKVEVLY